MDSDARADLLPPHSLDAEQAVLGAAMMSRLGLERALAILQPGDFYLEAHRRVFGVLGTLRDRGVPADSLMVPEELRRTEQLDRVGGMAYVNQLMDSVPTAAHIEHYAIAVLTKAVARNGMEEAHRFAAALQRDDEELPLLYSRMAERLQAGQRRLVGREGPRVMTMPELMAATFPPPVWLVDQLLPSGVCVLAGPPKARKSFWALCVGLAIAHGAPALGSLKVRQSAGLCVFFEDRFPEVQERSRQLGQGENPPPILSIAEDCPRMDEGGEAWLDHYLGKHPDCKYLVLDPLMRVRGGRMRQKLGRGGSAYQDDYADMEAFKRLVDRHGICLLILHHTRKLPSEDWLNALNGSTGITGSADVIMLIQSERGRGDAVFRATGRRVREIEWAMSWDDHAGWQVQGEAQAYGQTREEQEVLEVLERVGKPMRYSELVNAVGDSSGAKPEAVKKRISRMVTRGRLEREGNAYWIGQSQPGEDEYAEKVSPLSPKAESGNSQARNVSNGRGHGGVSPGVSPVPSNSRLQGTLGDRVTGGDIGDTRGQALHTFSSNGAAPAPLPSPLELPEDAKDPDLRRNTFNLAFTRGFPEVALSASQSVGPGEGDWRRHCTRGFLEWVTRSYARLGGEG